MQCYHILGAYTGLTNILIIHISSFLEYLKTNVNISKSLSNVKCQNFKNTNVQMSKFLYKCQNFKKFLKLVSEFQIQCQKPQCLDFQHVFNPGKALPGLLV